MPVPDDSDLPPSPSGPERDPEGAQDSLPSALEQDVAKEAAPGIRTDQPRFRRWLTIRDDPGGFERFFLGLACVLCVLLVWHILTRGEEVADRMVGPLQLPSLEETAKSFPALWFDRALMRGAFASLSRVLGGFLLAAVIAIPLGVIGGCYPRFHAFLRPLSIFGRNTPVACLIPLTLIWFGLGDLQKVMFIFIAAWAFIFFDTTQSVRGIAGNYLDTAYTLGARSSWIRGLRKALLFGFFYAVIALFGRYWIAEPVVMIAEQGVDTPSALGAYLGAPGTWIKALVWFVAGTLLWVPIHGHQAISKVLFPLALPHIVNSMRLLFGLAFGYIVLAELINAKLGLGNIILISQRRNIIEHIYLVLIVITIIAYTIDRLIIWIQRRAFPYATHGH